MSQGEGSAFSGEKYGQKSSFSKSNFGASASLTTGGISAMMSGKGHSNVGHRPQEYETKELRKVPKSTLSSQLRHSINEGKRGNNPIPFTERDNLDGRRGSVPLDSTKVSSELSQGNNSSTVVDTLCTHYLPTILSTHGSLPIRQLMLMLSETYPMFNVLSPTQQRRALTKALESQKGVMFDKVGWGRWILREDAVSTSIERPSSSAPNVSFFEKDQERDVSIPQTSTKSPSHNQRIEKSESTLPKEEEVSKKEDDMEIDTDMDVPVKQTIADSRSTMVHHKKSNKEETPGSYTAHLGGLVSPREQTPSLFCGQYHDNGVYYEEEDEDDDENDFYEDDNEDDSVMPPFVLDEDQVLDGGGESTDEEDWRGIGTEALLRKGNAVPLRRLSKGMLRKDQMAAEAMLMLHGSL
ncbi:ribosomal RNA processing element (RRPE)-binding protein [Schizosaccharomyces cryophilus OY26]|uniref:Ribosomal RNA processing element (RRPE)-binding protein n=1 Tax=Schizosaccharomyces cryophilus (strain OY26 / ATCC MYA-4695 / CBS 11777 / NBRC 106824 / NRRL Y48691) TaxID=653667 RepID=S9WZX7_SCHCR|nr:ribosomal RNA processing element (RRPE)-binding protein [Schizosaccharomyces cryophilus OY26]EPY50267.1 ribosomal RNA processing element (RRPE)-binding protein [Schizosaccharomyces cryophilus OY26]